jgi:hypothetical protein
MRGRAAPRIAVLSVCLTAAAIGCGGKSVSMLITFALVRPEARQPRVRAEIQRAVQRVEPGRGERADVGVAGEEHRVTTARRAAAEASESRRAPRRAAPAACPPVPAVPGLLRDEPPPQPANTTAPITAQV